MRWKPTEKAKDPKNTGEKARRTRYESKLRRRANGGEALHNADINKETCGKQPRGF